MKLMTNVLSNKCLWVMLILALNVAGCVDTAKQSTLHIVPLSNQDTLALNANDIVQVMRQAGFSDEQILEHGTNMHDGLSMAGATQLKVGNEVEAIFAVRGNCVYITSRMRGSFIYDVRTGWVTPSPQL
ncbi:MAG: hypothetical protein ACYSSI_02795 [Planctomycetota bacterium]|jgi:hypothetical protein